MNVLTKLIVGIKLKVRGIKSSFIQGISINTHLIVDGYGEIILNGKLYTRRNCSLRAKGKLIIGSNCSLNENVQIACHDCIVIGDDVIIGPNVVIVDHDHDYTNTPIRSAGYKNAKIYIGKDVWIGANCVILKGAILKIFVLLELEQ